MGTSDTLIVTNRETTQSNLRKTSYLKALLLFVSTGLTSTKSFHLKFRSILKYVRLLTKVK